MMNSYCPNCGEKLDWLDKLYFNSNTLYKGCQPCNIVWEYKSCCISGRSISIKKYILSYENYIKQLQLKKEEENDKKTNLHSSI
jgi:hypothetical protein